MEKYLEPVYNFNKEESRKDTILGIVLSMQRNIKSRLNLEYTDYGLVEELVTEGLIEKSIVGSPPRLTKKGIEIASSHGGYLGMLQEKFEKDREEVELRSMDLKIKQIQLENLEQKPILRTINLHKSLTIKEFEELIRKPESPILDFKRELYDFTNEFENKITAGFVKDVISFTNTIRMETSYIIFGIGENIDGSKEMLGIDKNIDEAQFQAKVKNKVYPIPHFSFHRLIYNEKTYGILSFPITKYEIPVSSKVKMPGLVVGKYYYRLGSSNEEASDDVVFRIYDWLKSLPTMSSYEETFSDKINVLLSRTTNKNEKLSTLITDILFVAKKYNVNELIDFCSYELKGITQKDLDESPKAFDYRNQTVVFSKGRITITPPLFRSINSNSIIQELRSKENCFEYNKMLFHQSITEIESCIIKSGDDKNVSLIHKRIKDLYPKWDKDDFEVTLYLFNDTFVQLYEKVRQKIIELLLPI